MFASVITNASIVAMFGWIMPAPFATPTSRPRLPPIVNVACATFGPTSVVRMACESASMPPTERRLTASGRKSRTFLSGSTTPITPVEARKTSFSLQRQQFRRARAHAFRGVEAFLAGDRVRAAGVDDDRLHAAAALLQRRFREHDRRGLKLVLREHGCRRRAVVGDDQAEVRTLLANAGANAGGDEAPWAVSSLQSLQCGLRGGAHAIRRGSADDVLLGAATSLDGSSVGRRRDALRAPTISCASRNGMPVAASVSAASVASSSGLAAAARIRSA